MNGALQCLVDCEPLTEYFFKSNYKSRLTKSKLLLPEVHLTFAYVNLLIDLFDPKSSKCPINPNKFRNSLSQYNPEFSGHAQKYSLEFLSTVLSGLHDGLNEIKEKPYVERDTLFSNSPTQKDLEDWGRRGWTAHEMRNKSVVVDLFHGMLKSTTICGECAGIEVSFDPFQEITVPLTGRDWYRPQRPRHSR